MTNWFSFSTAVSAERGGEEERGMAEEVEDTGEVLTIEVEG